MENVFQAGDVVYHLVHGEVPVLKADGKFVHVKLNSGTELITVNKYLSFTPWPAPNHIRPEPPIKDGWWLVTGVSDDTDYPAGALRYVKEGIVYLTDRPQSPILGFPLKDYTFIRYLGQDWKEETP